MKKIFLIFAAVLVLAPSAWAYKHYPRYTRPASGNVNLYDFINDIENLMDNILAFMQEHGGWVLIALMLLAVFASYRKKKQDKNEKQRNEKD